MTEETLNQLAVILEEAVGKGGQFVLLVSVKKGGIGKVQTLTTLDPGPLVSLLCQVVERRISEQLQNRRMGNELAAVPDALKEKMFLVLHGLCNGEEYSGIPKAAWRDLFLIWSASEAHDAGIGEHDFIGAALETANEEWSTPGQAGRVAVADLLEKVKPTGAEACPCSVCGAPAGEPHRSPLCR